MSLLEAFKKEVRALPVTAPIFEVSLVVGGWQGYCLSIEPVNTINHYNNIDDELYKTDTIKALAMSCARESIEAYQKVFTNSIEGAMQNLYIEIRRQLTSFIALSITRDTEIYKWYDTYALRERILSTTYIEPMLVLYKYICANCDVHYRNFDMIDPKHKQNAIGVLEFIYQRDAKPEHMPQPRKRRRRRK